MSSEGQNRQIIIGMGTSLTSAIVTASIVFFLLVMRKRLRDKQAILRNIQRMPHPRERSASAQSALSASGYSAGFRGASGRGGSMRPINDVQDGRQIRKVTAYNERSFTPSYIEGTSGSAILDPWDPVQPGRVRPLVTVHDPFYGRSRGYDRMGHRDTMSSAPPSEGHPAVSAFRASKLKSTMTPTTFYTYDGKIASTLNSYDDDQILNSREYEDIEDFSRTRIRVQGHLSSTQGERKGQDGRTYYHGKQHSNESLDSGALGASPILGRNDLYATPNKNYKKKTHAREGPNFQWHSTPLRQSSREPRERESHLPRTNSTLRRSSLDNNPSPRESLSWSGMEPRWRSDYSEISPKRRSGSYDELESRQRRRHDSSTDDGLAVFNWMPGQGPVISLGHKPSSTYDGDVILDTNRTESDDNLSRTSNDHDSALYSMEDLPKFTRSTAKLELSPDGPGYDNEALQLEEMYY